MTGIVTRIVLIAASSGLCGCAWQGAFDPRPGAQLAPVTQPAAMPMPTTDAELVRRIRQGGGDGYPYDLAKMAGDRVEQLGAALVSIGILNASGAHPDTEIDRAIREVARLAN